MKYGVKQIFSNGTISYYVPARDWSSSIWKDADGTFFAVNINEAYRFMQLYKDDHPEFNLEVFEK